MDQTETDKRRHLRKIIDDSRTGMFVTHNEAGQMHGRPMATAKIEGDFARLWFATSRSSGKIAELGTDENVMLGYTNSGGTEWAAVNGKARPVDDRAKINELWSPFWKNWFTGPDDPDLILLEVTPISAEYWDSGNKLVSLAKFAIGTVTGKDMSKEDNQRIDL